jgi:hypothetical protein
MYDPAMSEYRRWEVWVEGCCRHGAEMIGTAKGLTFREGAEVCLACNGYELDDPLVYDKERMTLLGCRLFDNEADARATFG